MIAKTDNNKKRVKMVINPDYLDTLKLISSIYNFESFNEFNTHVLSGKTLAVNTLEKSKSRIDQTTNSLLTQASLRMMDIEAVALAGTAPMVSSEYEKCRSILKASMTTGTSAAFNIVVGQLREAIETLKNYSVISEVDQSPTLLDLKSKLVATNIHDYPKGMRENLFLILDSDLYQKYFTVSRSKNPANRRSFKNAIETNISFFKTVTNTNITAQIEKLLSALNDFLHAMNSKQLQGDYTGSYELLKIVVNTKTQLKKKITEMEGANHGNS